MKHIKHIGIIGEGKMGSSMFHYFLPYEFKLSWLCSSKEGMEQATKFFGKKTRVLLKTGVITEEDLVKKTELTTITDSPTELVSCDLIVEAITEDREMKRQVFQSLDKIIKDSAIFTSNSSSILPSQLIPSEKRKDKIAGMHFFFPVNLHKTVELIYSPGTSKETIKTLDRFLNSIKKKALFENEENAFALNRILLDFQVGAYNILQEGKMTMKEIDDQVKSRFFSIGVFDFFDHVGVDVMLASIKNYTQNAGNQEFYAPLINKMEELVSQNRLGIKTKQGFYIYCKSLGDIRKAVSPEIPSRSYQQDVEHRLLNYYITSVNAAIASGIDATELAEAVKDNLGIEQDPFRLLIADC